MNRRQLFGALAALPLVGKLFEEGATIDPGAADLLDPLDPEWVLLKRGEVFLSNEPTRNGHGPYRYLERITVEGAANHELNGTYRVVDSCWHEPWFDDLNSELARRVDQSILDL